MGFDAVQDRIAYRLEYFREKSGMTKRQFARRIGVNVSTYNYYINREGTPTLYTAMVIAEKLGITLDELLGIRKEGEHGQKTEIGVNNLREALLRQAVEQHQRCLDKKLRERSKRDADPINDSNLLSVELFFRSDWGQLVSGGLGEYIIEQDYKIVRENIKEEKKLR